jgi:hypothetical protein
MIVGDLIARFEDDAVAAEALLVLGNPALMARVASAAAAQELTLREFATASVQRFAAFASDEDWLTMVGRISRAEDPGQAFLTLVLSFAIGNNSPVPAT